MEDVVPAATRDVGRDRGRQIGGRHVVHLDLAPVLLSELAREPVEPPVVVGNEVLPVNDLEDTLLLRRCAASEDRRRGERGACSEGALQKVAAVEIPAALLSVAHGFSSRCNGGIVQQREEKTRRPSGRRALWNSNRG